MKESKLREISERMKTMEDNAAVWTMVKIISSILSENQITYDQFLAITELIDCYTHSEAEIMASLDEEEIDIDDEDGEWFVIPEI